MTTPSEPRAFGYAVAGNASPLDEHQAAPLDFHSLAIGFGRPPPSLDDGQAAILDYFRRRLKRRGVEWAGMVVEHAGEATRDVRSMTEGRRLLAQLRPGDHLLIADVGTAFPDTQALCETVEHYAGKGVFIHVVSLMNLWHEADRECRRQRHRDVNTIRRLQGLPTQGNPPLGFTIVGPKRHRRYAVDHETREIMRWIVGQVDNGHSFGEVAKRLCRERVMWKRRSRSASRGYTWEFWDRKRVARAYHNMRALMPLEKRQSAGGTAV